MITLEDIPVEILELIVRYLPSATDIFNLSLTSRKIRDKIRADNYAILSSFVRAKYPSIRTPPIWKDALHSLTSRSRAWDRRAVIARACDPPNDPGDPHRSDINSIFGYVPVIDSYESWYGGTWKEKREVLVWGAAGRLRMRISTGGSTYWSTFRSSDDHLPPRDILDVRLLRPNQKQQSLGETVIFRRANNDILKLEALSEQDAFTQKSTFATNWGDVDCMDVSGSSEPLLATCNRDSIQLFHAWSDEKIVRPTANLNFESNFVAKHRIRCARFLSDRLLAFGVQFISTGERQGPIRLCQILPDGSNRASSTNHGITSFHGDDLGPGRHCANAIAPLDDIATLIGRPGEVFLSGWSNGLVKLHDIRTMSTCAAYEDVVDDGQILSLLPIGHERFLAGSHQNGCLKTFDLRMPGKRPNSYTSVRGFHGTGALRGWPNNHGPLPLYPSEIQQSTQRQINIFLSIHVPHSRRLWQPLPGRRDTRLPRYRGSIYSLSSPSPSSSTVYAGIGNHVIQLDFASTDDLIRNRLEEIDIALSINQKNIDQILNLACYERPRDGHESTDSILLRKQVDWGSKGWNDRAQTENGWDERWRLSTYDRLRNSNSGPAWRAARPR